MPQLSWRRLASALAFQTSGAAAARHTGGYRQSCYLQAAVAARFRRSYAVATMDQPVASIDVPHTHVTFNEDFALECGTILRGHTVAYRTYGTLNADRSNADAGLPCADRRPVRRRNAPGHRQAGLVGCGGRSRPPGRHRPLLRHLPQRAGRLHGQHRARSACATTARDAALGHRFPAGHHPRHGPRAEAADGPSGDRAAVRRDRRLDGRHAGAAMGGTYPDAVFAALPIATAAYHSAQNIAFHEVGRQAIFADPDWQNGRYWENGPHPGPRPRGRAHVRPHHLPVRGGADAEVRPPPAERAEAPDRGDPPVRRDVRGRELPAPPGQHLRAALRRQLLPDDHAGDGLLRPGGGLRRRPGGGVQGHAHAVPAGVVHLRLAVPDHAKAGRSRAR